MRIQHNIAAMNAYRNYFNNTSAVNKNLEKLSSGYKINRAGDDAAGLAISEKMRAQISGLQAASKNVKDGISLVKTAEGAMQEVQDMLNRMVTLATQSANGTYDNEVDRDNLQKEVEQLKSEINRIADSSNFNGIKLLDGSLDADGRRATTETVFAGLTVSNNKFGVKPDATKDFGAANSQGGLILTGGNLTGPSPTVGTDPGKATESDNSVRYHKDAAVSGKTSFTVDLDGINYQIGSGTKLEGLEFCLQASNSTDGHATGVNNLYMDNTTAADTTYGSSGTAAALKYDVVAGSDGITSEAIAKAIYDKIQENGGKVYIDPATVGSATAAQDRIAYSVELDGDKLTFTMTDDGYNKAVELEAANANATTPDGKLNYFQGNFNFGVAKTKGATNYTGDELAFQTAISDKKLGNVATCEVNEGSSPSGTVYAQAFIRFSVNAADANKNAGTAATNTSENMAHELIKDGSGLQIGDEYYIFAHSDEVYNTEYQDNVKVVDIRDLNNITSDKVGTQDYADDLRVALDRLSVAAKDNEMFDVQVEERGTMIVINERTTYDGDANLTEKNWGLESMIQKFSSATSKTTVHKEAGESLTLQIGDTSEDYNQLRVNIGDIHTDALKISDLDIGTQAGAAAAIDTIRNAINTVSSIRGTLGATQNRLEHTQNNLSVMTENIQDAESTIRDTDIAEEMMAYTKNNILVQSAQAMLAQANQIPQGVLQLLG